MAQEGSKRNQRRKRRRAWTTVVVAVPLVAFAAIAWQLRNRDSTADIFSVLQYQGYQPNTGFSTHYYPGTIIQVADRDAHGEQRLASPFVLLWASNAFPQLTPTISEFVLPVTQGRASASLTVPGKMFQRLVPGLALENSAVASYRMKLEGLRQHSLAKANLVENFSVEAVRSLDKEINAGYKLSAFEVIVESIMADGLTIELDWKGQTSALQRRNASESVSNCLRNALAPPETDKARTSSFQIAVEEEKRTVVSARGPVVLAYRALPLEYAKPPINTAQVDTEDPQLRSSTLATLQSTNLLPEAIRPPPVALRDVFYSRGTETTTDSPQAVGRIGLFLSRREGDQLVPFEHEFKRGDRFRFEITSSRDGWLYIVHISPTKKWQLLWPRSDGTGSHRILGGQTNVVPAKPAAFVFDTETGDESFHVAIRGNPAPPTLEDVEPGPAHATGFREATRIRATNLVQRYRPRDPFGGAGRSVVFDLGEPERDPHLYFSAVPEDGKTNAAIEFRLRHVD